MNIFSKPLAIIAVSLTSHWCFGANFTVTRTNDTGPGSLRAVLLQANAQPGPHLIEFATTGDFTTNGGKIVMATPLPECVQSLTLRGYRLTGSTNNLIQIVGTPLVFREGTTNVLQQLNINGAISNFSGLFVDSCVITNGGIYSTNSLNVIASTVISSPVYGIWSSGIASLDRVTIQSCSNGGLHNEGNMTIGDSLISSNACPADGGGLYTTKLLQITGCQIVGNRATNGAGGGVYAGGKTIISKSTIANNQAASGGGIFSAGNLEVVACAIANNNVRGISPTWLGLDGGPFVGGGGYGGYPYHSTGIIPNPLTYLAWPPGSSANFGGNGGIAYAGTITLTWSEYNAQMLGGNGGYGGSGGGVYVNSGPMAMTNCTISDNSTVGGKGANGAVLKTLASGGGGGGAGLGGGLCILGTGSSVVNCTIVGNRVVGGSGGFGGSALAKPGTNGGSAGGGIYSQLTNCYILNTIVSGNNSVTSGPDAWGAFHSQGYNFIGNSSGSGGWDAISDYQNGDPKIGPFQDNGGPTWTRELLYGSLCINSGTMEGAPDVDQRGVNRPQGNGVDIGAYEGLPIVAPVILGGLTNQSVMIGSNATWTVDVLGTRPLSVHWSFKGTNLINATNTSLALSNVNTNQSGLYTLTITNIAGEVSGSAFLTVLPTGNSPVITNQPASLSVASGETATFSVGARGSTPLRYQWQFNGSSLAGKTNVSLTISPVQLSHAGAYRVIVSNDYGSVTSSNASLLVDSIIVKPDDVIAAQGNEILVPVRVKRFNNVGSFQFSMHWNVDVIVLQAVERFGLPGMSGQNFGTTLASRLTVSWEAQSGQAQSLPDDSLVFVLRFLTVGGQGSTTPITIDGDPTPIEFLDGLTRPLIPEMRNGSVSVLPTIKLSGSIVYAGSAKPVPDVTMTALNTSSVSKTLTNGAYEIRVPTGSSPVITPSKTNDSPLAAEVTTGDILLIRRHVLSTVPLNSPFKLLAADVNDDGKITTGDILSIRRFILGVTNQMPRGLWRFVPADYTLDPANPYGAPGYIVRSNQTADIAGLNFIAVKLGDANLSWTNTFAVQGGAGFQPAAEASKMLAPLSIGSLTLSMGSGSAVSGGTVAVPVTVSGFTGVSTFQFSIHWDVSHMAFTGVDQFGLAGLAVGNFGQPAAGTLTVSWEDPTGTSSTLVNGSALCILNFQMLGAAGSSSTVTINGTPTPIEVLNAQLSSLTPTIQSGTVTAAGGGVAVQIITHPTSQTVIEGQPATFTVMANGTEPRTYQWRKDGTNISGATSATFSLAHALMADAGRYSVVVGNGYGAPVVSNAAELTVTPTSGNRLTFTIGSANVQPAASFVVPVKVSRFVNVSTVQFSLHWDTNLVAYEGLEQFGLTALAIGNFGQPRAGVLTLSWEDPSGGSSSLPDQTVIFAVRLRATGSAGTATQVTIDGNPTPIEVLDGQLASVTTATMPGLISIQGATGLDSDNDGLTDEEELRLGTNPYLADTDGDGYNDGLEVRLGTDPRSANSRPEALSIYTAVELEMVTLTNRQYQFEISTNLNSWTPYGYAFPGTGSVSNKLISIKGTPATYWRLRVLP